MNRIEFFNVKNRFFNNPESGTRLFMAAYVLCLFAEAASQTMFRIPASLFTLCKIGALCLILFKILAFDRYDLKSLVSCLVMVAVSVLVMIVSGYMGPLIWTFILIGAKDVPFRKILETYLIVTVSIITLAFFASLLGIIENLRYQKMGSSSVSFRNSFGVIYPTDFAAFVFFILLTLFYLKGANLKSFHYIAGLASAAFLYYFCQARLDSISVLLLVCLFALINFKRACMLQLKAKYRKSSLIAWLGCICMPAAALIMFLLTALYSPSNAFLKALDELITTRLSLGKQGLEEYGIKLWGQYIRMVGNGGSTTLTDEYFFIDCSYLYILLLYGLVFFLIVMLVYFFCCLKKRNDIYYIASILLIAVNGMIAHRLTDIAYDAFALLLFADITNKTRPTPYVESLPPKEGNSCKKSEPSVRINFIMNSILTVSSIVFPMLTFPYVSRVLGPEKMGTVTFAASVVSYFSILAQLGIPVYGIRACSQVRNDKELLSRTFSEIFVLNIITCIITYGLFFLSVILVPRFSEMRVLLYVTGITILLNTIGVQWLYQALEKYSYITFCSLLFKFISIISIFLLVRRQDDFIYYAIAHVLSNCGSCIFNFIYLRRHIDLPSVSSLHLKRHIQPILIFFAMSVSITIYTNLDTVMLGFMKSDLDVGYYNTAVKVKALLVAFITSLGTVLLPRASFYLNQGKTEEFYAISKKAIHFVILLSIPLAIYFTLFSGECILILAGNQYMDSVTPMIIIMPTLLLIGLTNIMGMQMLVPMGREKTVMYSTLFGAITDIVINALLIPEYASSGAAFGTLIAECVVFIYQYLALRKAASSIYQNIPYGRICIASVLPAFISLGVRHFSSDCLIVLFISAVLYFSLYIVFLVMMKEPLIRQLISQFAHNVPIEKKR